MTAATGERLRSRPDRKPRMPILLVAHLLIPAFAGIASAQSAATSEAVQRMQHHRQDVVGIDLRPVSDYESQHIPDALNVPPTRTLKANLPKDKPLVLYCGNASCVAGHAAAKALAAHGYTKVSCSMAASPPGGPGHEIQGGTMIPVGGKDHMHRLRVELMIAYLMLQFGDVRSFAAQPDKTERSPAASGPNTDISEDSQDAQSVPELYRRARKEMEDMIKDGGNGSLSSAYKLGHLQRKARGRKPRTEAAIAAIFSELMKELSSAREATRRQVIAETAVHLASREEVAALFPLLADPDTRVAGGVVVTIAQRFDCEPQIATWVMSQQDRNVASRGIEVLRTMNLPSSEASIRMIAAKHSNPKVRKYAESVLAHMEKTPRRGQHLMPRKSK